MSGIAGVDNDLYIVNSSGSILQGSENPAGTDEQVFRLMSAGTYYVVVNNYSGSSASPYWLYIFFSSNPDSAEIDDFVSQATAQGSYFYLDQNIDSPLDQDYITFTITGTEKNSGFWFLVQ